MFVRTLEDLEGMGRIKFPSDDSFRSARFPTTDDGIGCGLADVRLEAGAELALDDPARHQTIHLLSVCGRITDSATGEAHSLGPGVASCALGPGDGHRLIANSALHVLRIGLPA